MIAKYERQCPKCQSKIHYETRTGFDNANKNKSCCRQCANKKADYTKLYNRFKVMAEQRGKEFTITEEYLRGIIDGCGSKCFYTNIPLDYTNMSIDRTDSSIGYVHGNVKLVHKKVNMMKQSYNEDVFVEMATLISKKYENEQYALLCK